MKMVDVAEHADIKRLYPAIAAAAIEVGTPQIRNQGTVGGNLNQRPRCWYFRNEEFNCLKKGGTTCFSITGENQFNAILGGGPSFIVHPSSLAVPMLAYGASFRIVGPKGERTVPASEYFTLPRDGRSEGERPRARRAPDARDSAGARQRQEWPLRSALQDVTRLAHRLRDGAPHDERQHGALGEIVLGAVAPIPWRATAAEQVLAGKTITEQTAMAAAEAALKDAQPLGQNAYKVQVAKTAVQRAILRAAGVTVA